MRSIEAADEEALPSVKPADEDALPTILRASILGLLATAAVLGVVSATAGLAVAGWIAGLATGSAAAVLIAAARTRSDQPSVHPADWVTLTRAVLVAGVAGVVADSLSRAAVDHSPGHPVHRRAGTRRRGRPGGSAGPAPPPRWAHVSTARSTPSSSCCSALSCPAITAIGCWPSALPVTCCCWRAG